MIEIPNPRPTALFLSPHLDDVAFSCGGTVAALHRLGWRVAIGTIFTASVPRPSGFPLACQLDKGLAADIDYMALRRDEDTAFGRAVGVDDLFWLGLPEAPHRGYASAPALFADILPGDAITRDVHAAITGLVGRLAPHLVFAPQAVGGHVDHRQVVHAALGLKAVADRLIWYRDLPYAEKWPESPTDPALPRGLVEIPTRLDSVDLGAKLAGCSCYATQVPFQFGDVVEMGRRLAAFAAAEATRLTVPGPVETFLARARAASWLATATRSPALTSPVW